jgi:hypothetical protein
VLQKELRQLVDLTSMCSRPILAAHWYKRNLPVRVSSPMRRLQANTDIAAWRIVDGEAVIVHAVSSAYYGLNSTGTFIWESIVSEPMASHDIADRVTDRIGVTGDSIRDEVEAFLASLEAEGLACEAAGAPVTSPTAAASAPPAAGGPFVPPRLARFGELEQLVLSGE